MKFERVYDSHYKHMIIGYAYEEGFIAKDAYLTWTGNEVIEGWSVENKEGKRMFYASTLKEAKAFVEAM